MERPEREEKITVEMCYHKSERKDPCCELPKWKLQNTDSGRKFKVCDIHLAWGIRLCGAPAMVDEYSPREKTREIMPEKKISEKKRIGEM